MPAPSSILGLTRKDFPWDGVLLRGRRRVGPLRYTLLPSQSPFLVAGQGCPISGGLGSERGDFSGGRPVVRGRAGAGIWVSLGPLKEGGGREGRHLRLWARSQPTEQLIEKASPGFQLPWWSWLPPCPFLRLMKTWAHLPGPLAHLLCELAARRYSSHH